MAVPFSWRDRAAIQITGELDLWYVPPMSNTVLGLVRWSNDKSHVPGDQITLLNTNLVLIPQSNEFGEPHFIAETQTQRYFVLKISRAKK